MTVFPSPERFLNILSPLGKVLSSKPSYLVPFGPNNAGSSMNGSSFTDGSSGFCTTLCGLGVAKYCIPGICPPLLKNE